MDSVDSYKRRTCPHYPQPYDDGVPLLRGPSRLPEDHNKHSLKWYILWGKPQINRFPIDTLCLLAQAFIRPRLAQPARLVSMDHHRMRRVEHPPATAVVVALGSRQERGSTR